MTITMRQPDGSLRRSIPAVELTRVGCEGLRERDEYARVREICDPLRASS